LIVNIIVRPGVTKKKMRNGQKLDEEKEAM
jgi:hypothetical protein